MKNNILHIFFLALAALFCLCSCGLEEPYIPDSNNGTIDIVFRPTSYHNLNVGTKANSTVFDVEDAIYSAFLIVFDNQGRCILRDPLTITDNRTISARTLKTDRSLSSATVCVIVNVPQAFVNEWTSDNNDNYTSDLDKFMHAEIDYSSDDSPFSFAAQSTTTPCVGIPQVVLNDEVKQCFPMFGYTKRPCDLSMSGTVQIEIKRLFARIDLTVSLDITEDDSILTSKPQFTLNDCEIFNIPQKVSLITSDRTSCAAVTGDQAGALLASELMASFNLSNVNSTTSVDNIVSNQTTGKSIYFYVPEHKLGITDPANADQKNKPLIIDDTPYKALYATISGILVDGSGVSHEAKYHLYFGLNSTNDFDINRNTKYNNLLTITGISENESDHRVELEQLDGFVESLVTRGKTANCYIIGTTGTYLLPAYRGAFNEMANADICDMGTNEVLVCDNPNITIEIDNELSKQSTIVLKISHSASVQNIVMTGNAVIARRNTSGEIDWSWHLWFVPGLRYDSNSEIINIGEISIGGVYTNNMPGGTLPMMDRNLGCVSESADISSWIPGRVAGLYYRYGYKEPYISGINMNGDNVSLDYHGSEVDCYSEWNSDEKSRTDPCPIGYRVPSSTTWSGANYNDATKEHATMYNAFRYWKNGGRYDVNNLDDTYYPYIGWYVGTTYTTGETGGVIDSGDVRGTKKFPSNQDTKRVITSLPSDPPVRYSNIEYDVTDGQRKAHLLGSDGLLISYGYDEDGFTFTCTREVGVWKEDYYTNIIGIKKYYYIADYTTSNEGYSSNVLTGDEVKEINESHYNDLMDEISDDYNGFFGGILDALTQTAFFNVGTETAEADNGYQVRCVQEPL